MKKLLTWILTCTLLFHFNNVHSQEEPKLGLVLSGGGAMGVAHIGIIRAMEEAGLRPDFIAGTSMGSIIGALYALGYSADQMEEIVLAVDWEQILSNEVPLNYIAFEEKEYYNRYLAEFPIDKGSVKLSSGLIKGQILNEVLHYYLWPSFQYDDFDDFPIPFRCVATNVANAQPIVFKDGSLPIAVRSSMAIPTAFTAVDLDSTLAVDGGVLNNFPVEIVQEMGADYIIGINVGGTTTNTKTPESMIEILLSLATIPSTTRIKEQIEKCDMYFQPDIEGYSTTSFFDVPVIMEIGRVYGEKQVDKLKEFAQKIGMNREHYSLDLDYKEFKLDSIKLEGNHLFGDELIETKMDLDHGDIVSRDQLREGLRRVYGINGFNKVDYTIDYENDSLVNLNVRMFEKYPDHLYVSLHADNVFSEGLLVNYTARDLIFRESRSVFALDISGNPRFRFDYYKYGGRNKKLALNIRYDFQNEQLPIYVKGELNDVNINQLHRVALNVMTTQSLKSSYIIGGFYENNQSKSKFGTSLPGNIVGEDLKKIAVDFTGIRFQWLRNSLNHRNFPTRGMESQLIANAYLNTDGKLVLPSGGMRVITEDTVTGVDTLFIPNEIWQFVIDEFEPGFFANAQYTFRTFLPLAKNMQMIPRLAVGLTLATEDIPDFMDQFSIGGNQRVWIDDVNAFGLNYNELTTHNFGLVGLRFQNVFYRNFFLVYGADFMGSHSYIPVDRINEGFNQNELSDNLFLGYGARLTWRTRIGPVSGGISNNTFDGYFRYYFAFGFSFNYAD